VAINPRNLEWLNHNATRRYPLAMDADGTDVTGTFRIPNDFLVSLYLAVPASASVSPAGFHIKTIGAYSSGYSVVVGYAGEAVASALVAKASHVRNTPYRLGGLGDFVDATGVLVVGNLGAIDAQAPGQYSFEEENGRLEVDCIRPNIRNIVSLQCQNGNDLSSRVYGDVILRAGQNVRLTPDLTGAVPVITFDAIEGEGLNEECVCVGDTEEAPPIRTINGIPATPDGDFTLLGSDCIELQPLTHGLRLNNTCSFPCCGAPELQIVVDQLQLLRTQISNLEQFASALEGRASVLDSALFASRLGDGGCQSC